MGGTAKKSGNLPVPGTRNAWVVGDYFDITSNTWKTLAEYYG